MVIPVPTLSSAGWVVSPAEKADMLISHFYLSDKFQTLLYGNNVTNIQWLIEQHGHDITALTQQLRIALEIYLGRYYPTVNVDVRNNDTPENPEGKIELKVYCSVVENGKEYSFGQLVVASNSKFEKIIKLNNTGNT